MTPEEATDAVIAKATRQRATRQRARDAWAARAFPGANGPRAHFTGGAIFYGANAERRGREFWQRQARRYQRLAK